MTQQGYVIEIVDRSTAKIRMTRHSACASCGKCATTSEAKDIIVEVDNAINARVGDRVEVNMETMNVLKATTIAYFVPLTFLLIGVIGTYYVLQGMNITSNIEAISAVSGLVFMGLAFLVLRLKDSKFRQSKEYIPVITKVLL